MSTFFIPHHKNKSLIINADSSTPMLPVWMPERILETGASIGNVLTSLEINTALVAERVTILKEYPFIGVMGYAAGENPFSYPELKYEKIKLFVAEAAKLVDYIILDCSSNMLNFFTRPCYPHYHAGPARLKLPTGAQAAAHR